MATPSIPPSGMNSLPAGEQAFVQRAANNSDKPSADTASSGLETVGVPAPFPLFSCQSCHASTVKIGNRPGREIFGDQLRTGTCTIPCEYGHKNIVCLSNFRFDMHFQMGLYALRDGYYAESTFGFAKALERFQEFCIQVFTVDDCSPEIYKAAWNQIAKRTECQLGAFIFLYLQRFHEAPDANLKFTPKCGKYSECSAFRNDVVHSGYLPSKEEAFAYGKVVFNFIKTVLVKLHESDKDKINKVQARYVTSLAAGYSLGSVGSMGGGTIFSAGGGGIERLTFEDIVRS